MGGGDKGYDLVTKGDNQNEMLMKPLHLASCAWGTQVQGTIQLFSGTMGTKAKGSSKSLVSSVCSEVRDWTHIVTKIQCVLSPLLSPGWGQREEARGKVTDIHISNI